MNMWIKLDRGLLEIVDIFFPPTWIFENENGEQINADGSKIDGVTYADDAVPADVIDHRQDEMNREFAEFEAAAAVDWENVRLARASKVKK